MLFFVGGWDIEIKNNILHISGNEIQGYSKASILEVNLFRFYYFTKNLRNMALIELRDFLDADVIAK